VAGYGIALAMTVDRRYWALLGQVQAWTKTASK
jgi:hypothetical protein